MKKLLITLTGILLLTACRSNNNFTIERDEDNLFLNTAPGKKMIVDLDMCTDVDDVCALRIATALDDAGIIDLQAVTLSVTGPNNIEAAHGFLVYDGKPDVPIGRSEVDNWPHESPYWDIHAKYNDGKAEVMDAVALYRKVLAEADSPVDIVTTGYVTNLEFLLKSGPDKYSPLDGTELVRQKVGQTYVVGTTYPHGHCNNVHVTFAARKAADYINRNWPLPIIWFTNDVGGRMTCGAGLQRVDTGCRDLVTQSLVAFGTNDGRWAWDPFGVWAGALACNSTTRLGLRRGNLEIDLNTGDNVWTDDENGQHFTVYRLENDLNYYNNLLDEWLIKKAKLNEEGSDITKVENVIIDADTDNEVDDLIAIMAALKSDNLDIIGMTAVQWDGRNNPNPDDSDPGWNSRSAYTSWLLNHIMVQMLGRPAIPLLKGSEQRIVYKKGSSENKGRDCEAADFIIEKAKALVEGEKLTIISTGALTNVASAVMKDPSIAKRIALYWLGQTYVADDEKRWVGEYEFNVSNDLDAFDLLCDTEDLEFHIMPTNVSQNMWFPTADSVKQLDTLGQAGQFIADRWRYWVDNNMDSGRIIWDLAMIYAITNPELATQTKALTPSWTTQRQIDLYTSIDAPAMRDKFWRESKR